MARRCGEGGPGPLSRPPVGVGTVGGINNAGSAGRRGSNIFSQEIFAFCFATVTFRFQRVNADNGKTGGARGT
jgi:hypothetical protein